MWGMSWETAAARIGCLQTSRKRGGPGAVPGHGGMAAHFRFALAIGVIILMQTAVSMGASAQNGAGILGGDGTDQDGSGHGRFMNATSWGYQLQGVEPTVLAATPYDVLVIDYSRDGSAEEAFVPQDLDLLKHKLDGERRVVLAYLSIGEAEDYRFYWDPRWSQRPPKWLGEENPDWQGNYAVRYWDRDWQGLIFGGAGAYLDRIINAGFDGVYLDRIDAFDEPLPELPPKARMAAMSAFVQALAAYARDKRPGFIVVAQNGEELLADQAYRNAIDGLGKEDLFFGIDGDAIPNAKADIRASLTPIEALLAAGKRAFLVEYLTRADQIKLVRNNAAMLGMPVFIADRELDHARSR
jgi:cysteinyl-tRNA synthetase